jgi:NitT/TauT family transport system substrate-binding protein
LSDVDSIPLIIAKQKGYFEKEGVNVDLKSFKSAMDRDSALQTGNIDGAISDVLAAAFAKDGGFDVKITSKTDGSYKLLVNKNSKISNLQDLKGKSVAISKNTIIEYATDMMVTEGKLNPDDINKTVIKDMPARLEMLQNGKIDAATLPEPLASVAVKNGATLLNSSDKLGINPGVLLFTTKATQDKSVEIAAFYKAYNSAVEYLQKEPVGNYIDALIKDAGFPEDVKGTIKLPSYSKAVMVGEKDFTNVIKWLKEKQLIKNEYKFAELIYDKYVK